MILENYLDNIQYQITYEQYIEILDNIGEIQITESFLSTLRNMKLPRELFKVFTEFKINMQKIASEFKLNIKDLVEAFKQKEIFNLLKAFSFNIGLIFRSILELTKLIRNGLLSVFKVLYETKAIQKIRQGVLKIDEVLNRYPLLKKVAGITLAGLLIFIWLNMTFIGNFDYDFNFTDTLAALKGTFSLADLFISPEGLMLITLFGTGTIFGISIAWLGSSVYNLILALVYTIYYKYKGKDINFKKHLNDVKRKLKITRLN